jgi:transcriptional regulator NrdR family protein
MVKHGFNWGTSNMNEGRIYCFNCHRRFSTQECVQVTESIWVCTSCAPDYYDVVDRMLHDMEEDLANQTAVG